MEEKIDNPRSTTGKLRRQPSRLQMHAPSSIQVRPPPMAAEEWNVVIPLLSPLDIVEVPRLEADTPPSSGVEVRPPVGQTGDERQEEKNQRISRWRHPAMPFHLEPAPGNAPAFFFPHCT